MESFIVYANTGYKSVSVTSTTDRKHADALKEWLEEQGYTVSVSTLGVKRDGSQH